MIMILPKFNQICPNLNHFAQICPNLNHFAQICPNLNHFAQISPKSNQICSNLINFAPLQISRDATASPAPCIPGSCTAPTTGALSGRAVHLVHNH